MCAQIDLYLYHIFISRYLMLHVYSRDGQRDHCEWHPMFQGASGVTSVGVYTLGGVVGEFLPKGS